MQLFCWHNFCFHCFSHLTLSDSVVNQSNSLKAFDFYVEFSNFRAQYQIDEESDGEVWLTHPHPALADSLQTIDDNQRTVKGTIDVSLRPFGKVCSVLFLN